MTPNRYFMTKRRITAGKPLVRNSKSQPPVPGGNMNVEILSVTEFLQRIPADQENITQSLTQDPCVARVINEKRALLETKAREIIKAFISLKQTIDEFKVLQKTIAEFENSFK